MYDKTLEIIAINLREIALQLKKMNNTLSGFGLGLKVKVK